MKRLLPYILTSLLLIGFWKLRTWTDNYAFSPEGKELLMLDIALTSIFIYKTFFWLVIGNLTVFSYQTIRAKNYKVACFICVLIITFYFAVGHFVDRKCAFHYFTVFHNQSVMEEFLESPILEAGYQIGPILTEKIADKTMKYRLYAIGGLEKLDYRPATPILNKILLDKSEKDVFRANAFQALSTFDTDETNKIITKFRQQAVDSLDRKVIELGEYFIKNN